MHISPSLSLSRFLVSRLIDWHEKKRQIEHVNEIGDGRGATRVEYDEI